MFKERLDGYHTPKALDEVRRRLFYSQESSRKSRRKAGSRR
jgi:hypothetical protein